MPELKLIQKKDSLVQIPEICLYEGESVKVSVKTSFEWDHFYAFVNNKALGKIYTEEFGIHSSKLNEGENDLLIDFFDNQNVPIEGFHVTVYKRHSKRGLNKVEEEYTNFYKELTSIKAVLDGLIKWKEEIDSERSGY